MFCFLTFDLSDQLAGIAVKPVMEILVLISFAEMVWGDDVHRGELALVSNRGGAKFQAHCMNFMASPSFQQEKMSKAV